MTKVPANPHAIVEIERPNFSDGQGTATYDSWDMPRLFQSATVDLVSNETSQAEWTIFDPRFSLIDSFAGSSPVPMSTVKVWMGFGQELGEPVFKGLLGEVRREQASTVFTAFDMAFKMKLEKKAGYKNKKDELAIIRELAKRNGLNFEGPETPLNLGPRNATMQDEATDWDHSLELARDAGLVLFVRGDTLFAKRPAKVSSPVMTLKNRGDIRLRRGWNFAFHTPENRDGRPKVVRQRGRGSAGKQLEGASGISPRGREDLVVKRDVPGKATKSKLSKRAAAQKELDREHAFHARVETIFPTDRKELPDARQTIAIENVGKLFSGSYIADTVNLQFGPGELSVSLDLYRDIAE